MNERIAKALVLDLSRTRANGGKLTFKDDSRIYTVEVTVEAPLQKRLDESFATKISVGSSGSPCQCCGGSGKS